MSRFLILAALALGAPAAAQTVSGCGTTTIAKASLASASKLTAEAGCFGKARDLAAGAVAARQAQIARLAPAPAPVPAPPSPAIRGPIGMNLAGLNNYSGQVPFIDRMKNSQGWLVNYSDGRGLNTIEKMGIPVDAGGTPTLLPADANNFATQIPFDEIGTGTTRRYVLLYDGPLRFAGGPGVRVDDWGTGGKITFTQAEYGPQQINFSPPFTGIHNIRVVREDQEALLAAGQTFNPAFLERVKRMSVIRFMDWQATNNSKVVHWSDRQPMASASWANNGGTAGEAGAPIELMVQLANEAHVEPWFCIPAHADDDYVRQFATYVRDHLAADLRPHIEYSNEVWNPSFEQAHYAQDQATKLIGPNANNHMFYGYRAAQVALIVRSVMGDRARMVIGVWTTWPASTPYVFQGVAMVGDASKLFDEYAVTTYFGGAFAGRNAHDIALILGWAKAGQAGVDAAFDAITNGGVFEEDQDSLVAAAGFYVPHAALAKQYGLDLVAYEGGFGTDAYFGFSGADATRVADFIRRMKASPRMGVAVTRMVTDFQAAGGMLLNYYNDVGDVTWGAAPNAYQSSPTLEALTAINAAGGR